MTLLTPNEVADRLRVTRGALTYWRSTNQGPRFIKLGKGAVRYPVADFESWLAAQETGGEAVPA